MRFSLAAGRLRTPSLKRQPMVLDGLLRRGLDNRTTAYLGGQASPGYTALMIGAALNTRLGALAADLTRSQARIHGQHEQGSSLGLAYARSWPAGGPALTVELRHAPSPGYQTLTGAAHRQDSARPVRADAPMNGLRDRASANLTLDIGRNMQLNTSAMYQRDWENPRWARQYQIGYTYSFERISLGLDIARVRNAEGQPDGQARLTLSIPLGTHFGGSHSLSSTFSRRHDGAYDERLALRGTAGSARQLSYSLSRARSSESSGSTSLGGTYQSSRALVSGAMTQGNGYRNTTLGLNGSLVAHPEGVTLTPMQGDTFAVLVAPGGAGARVARQPGLVLDSQGHAVVAGLQPYQMNELILDPASSADTVEFDETEQRAAPRSGAVLMVKYPTRSGSVLLARGILPDNTPLPFSASLQDDQGRVLGVVGQGGLIYLRLENQPETVMATWGKATEQQCRFQVPHPLPDANEPPRELICHP